MSTTSYPQIFLCCVNDDKQKVNEVYERLCKFGLRPWMVSHDLVPGKHRKNEIRKALRESMLVLIFFSNASVNRQGFAQKEIRDAIELLDERPPGEIFSIPVRLDTCDIPHERLRELACCDLFQEDGFEKLIGAIKEGMVSSGNVQPLIIKTRDERTTYLTNELTMFYTSHEGNLSEQVIRYSGSLSSFAIDKENPDLQRDNPEFHELLLKEKAILLKLAEHGCHIKCIITPPSLRGSLFKESVLNALYNRVKDLIHFLESEHPALEHIDWAVSSYRQKNLYIIGELSYYEGFKGKQVTSYDLTLWQTGLGVSSTIALYDTLFTLLANDMLNNFGENSAIKEYDHTEKCRESLRNVTIKVLKKRKDFLEVLKEQD